MHSETETSITNAQEPIIVNNYNTELAELKVRLESLEDDFTKLTAFVNTLAEKLKK